MKRYLLSFFMFSMMLPMLAQNISVQSFRLAEDDQSANTAGAIVYDQNANKCALIKVMTPYKDFYFDAGTLGVMKVEEKQGQTWVYVPGGVKRLKISHQKFGTLRDYDLGMMLKSAKTYIMELTTAKVQTAIGAVAIGEVEINSDPLLADVYIDGRNVGQTPLTLSDLSVGKHMVRLSRLDCKDYMDSIEVKANDTATMEAAMHKTHISFDVGGVSFTMVQVDGGTFQMGATQEQKMAFLNERPVHEVTLSSYMIGETEVTQELWGAVMGSNNSRFQDANLPVDQVSWDDCQEFVKKLNAMTGKNFRLPTEAEWEFAARGGNVSQGYRYCGSNDLDAVAWYWANSGDKPLTDDEDSEENNLRTHEVKTKLPNELGIYDMSGNVYEWCQDYYQLDYYASSPSVNPKGPEKPSEVKGAESMNYWDKDVWGDRYDGYRVIRGGSFCEPGYGSFRVCHRIGKTNCDNGDGDGLGFRLVL